LSSHATILNQIQNGVDYYASQSSIIQSSIATNFQGYTLIAIDSTAIKTSIQIRSYLAEARTFTASLSNVLLLQSTSSASLIDPNLVFANLTTLVDFLVLIHFQDFY
jgi:hypothetical protein